MECKCFKCDKKGKYQVSMNNNDDIFEYVCEDHLADVDIFNELAKRMDVERKTIMTDTEIEFLKWIKEKNYILNGSKIYYNSRYGYLYLGEVNYCEDMDKYSFKADDEIESNDCYGIKTLAVTLLDFYINK